MLSVQYLLDVVMIHSAFYLTICYLTSTICPIFTSCVDDSLSGTVCPLIIDVVTITQCFILQYVICPIFTRCGDDSLGFLSYNMLSYLDIMSNIY